jgi:hypothetical protein
MVPGAATGVVGPVVSVVVEETVAGGVDGVDGAAVDVVGPAVEGVVRAAEVAGTRELRTLLDVVPFPTGPAVVVVRAGAADG